MTLAKKQLQSFQQKEQNNLLGLLVLRSLAKFLAFLSKALLALVLSCSCRKINTFQTHFINIFFLLFQSLEELISSQ